MIWILGLLQKMVEEDDKKKVFPFHEMGLDDRVLKAIAKLGWVEPTLIQVIILGLGPMKPDQSIILF